MSHYTLSDYVTKLAAVNDSIDELINSGKAYTIVGSHTVQTHDMQTLTARKSALERAIARMRGIKNGRKRPDFSYG